MRRLGLVGLQGAGGTVAQDAAGKSAALESLVSARLGHAVTTFSDNDPTLSLLSLTDGRWQGSWFGANVRSAKISLTANAQLDVRTLRGALTLTGILPSNDDIPSVTPGALMNAAQPQAPPSLISIAGKSFAFGQTSASQLRLSVDLAGTQLILAGRSGLFDRRSDPCRGAVHQHPDGVYSLAVARGAALSGLETVAVAGEQPRVFKVDASGDPQVAQTFWAGFLSGAAVDPASAVPGPLPLYCTGLVALDTSTQPRPPLVSGLGQSSAPVSIAVR